MRKSKHVLATPDFVGVIAFVLIIVLLIFCVFHLSYKESTTWIVQTLSWQRYVPIERFSVLNQSDWDENVPKDAYNTSKKWKYKEESCSGIGDDEECESIYDWWITYTVNRWLVDRTLYTYGSTNREGDAIRGENEIWYAAPDLTRNCELPYTYGSQTANDTHIGCERVGARIGTYTVVLNKKNETTLFETCSISETLWSELRVKTVVQAVYYPNIRIKNYLANIGGLDCGTLSIDR